MAEKKLRVWEVRHNMLDDPQLIEADTIYYIATPAGLHGVQFTLNGQPVAIFSRYETIRCLGESTQLVHSKPRKDWRAQLTVYELDLLRAARYRVHEGHYIPTAPLASQRDTLITKLASILHEYEKELNDG